MTTLSEALALARDHYRAGCLQAAEQLFQQILAVDPDQADAWHLLGLVSAKLGKPQTGEECIRRALALRPRWPEAYNNLGITLKEQNKHDEAVVLYHQALELRPGYASAHNNLGNALLEQGELDEAIGHFRRAVTLKPSFAEAHNNLGNTLKEQGKLDEAITCYRQALQLRPDIAEMHGNLGNALKEQGMLDEAAACYRRAVERKPGYLAALGALVGLLQHLCYWDDVEALSQRLIEGMDNEAPRDPSALVPPFALSVLPTITTAKQQLRCAQQWADRVLKASAVPAQARTGSRPSGPRSKLVIGYLSADFRSHAVARLIAELIEKHHRARFAVFAYSYGPEDGSPMRQRLVKAFDRFVDVKDVSYRRAAEQMAADGVDILVDLQGYTMLARTQILTHRPAPVQVNYLGYPGTLGTPLVDYILVDDFVVPPDQQPFFTEKLVHLPGCYQVNDGQRAIAPTTPARTACGLPETGVVFCCFNNNYKITPAVFGVWMRLLRGVPGSVLWLLEGNRIAPDHLRREAEARGVAAERLVFARRLALAEHLARYRLADLFLDTFPMNAHTTASDALWAGCPVVTMAGETFLSRVAGSLLRTVGLPELITTSLADYEALALRLARDEYLRGELRAKLAAHRGTSSLFDAETFARNLETAYEMMWAIHASGEPPRAFAVRGPGSTSGGSDAG